MKTEKRNLNILKIFFKTVFKFVLTNAAFLVKKLQL